MWACVVELSKTRTKVFGHSSTLPVAVHLITSPFMCVYYVYARGED